MASKRRRKKKCWRGWSCLIGLIIWMILSLTGCHQNMIEVPFCFVYRPVSETGKISPEKQRLEVKRNNLKYEELCET